MTRKHFEALAAALKDSKPPKPDLPDMDWSDYREALAQWRADVRAILNVLGACDPNLSFARFYAICGYALQNHASRKA